VQKAMSSPWKIEVYRNWDEVDSPDFLESWNTLIDAAPEAHVFYHPAVLKAWTDTYRKLQNINPLYCLARCSDMRVFLPLILWRRNWKNAFTRVIVPAGYSDYDYHDPIFTGKLTPHLMESFWSLIEKEIFGRDGIKYDRIIVSGIRYPGKNDVWIVEDEVCPYVDLASYPDYEKFYLSLKKSMRYDVEKKIRRLKVCGEITYRKYGKDNVQAAREALPLFLDAHQQRWPNAYKAPGLHDAIIANGIQAGVIHFSELAVDSKVINWVYGFVFKNKYYYYMPASFYGKEYVKNSPGKAHISYLLEDCFNHGITLFDFLRGSESYKYEWDSKTANVYSYTRNSNRLHARFINGLLNNKSALNAIINRS
jgi:CelD/BcsL family acetyltransferase involved in cellulose biosynthesis